MLFSVVLGVVLEQVEAVAKPSLAPVLKQPPPGPPKPPPGAPKPPPGQLEMGRIRNESCVEVFTPTVFFHFKLVVAHSYNHKKRKFLVTTQNSTKRQLFPTLACAFKRKRDVRGPCLLS